MSRSERPGKLIVIVLALLGLAVGPARSAPLRAPAQEAEVEKEKADKEQAEKKEAATEEKKEAATEEKKEAATEEKKDIAEPSEKDEKKDDKKDADADKDKGATSAEKAEKKAEPDPALKEAARIVVKQLKAAAAAIGIQSEKAAATEEGETAHAEVDKKDEKKDAPPKKKRKKKKVPQPPMFRMRDGTRIAGKAQVDVLHMTTAYGSLEVPIADIVHVRFSSPRDTQVGERVQALVEQLGSDEFDLREEASEGLRAIGVPALDALKEATRSEDQEVKTRAEKLVGELEEELDDLEEDQKPFLVSLQGEEDEVVTLKFTAVGRVDVSHFSVTTSYGQLKLDRADILSIVFRPPPFRQLTFQIGGTKAYAGNNKWVDTGLKLTQGGFLKITATGSLNLSNYGTNCSPDGTTGVPTNGLDSFPVGALVGKIGAKGKPFLVGSEYESTANATGNLQLGISFKSGTVRGQFEAEVEVEIEEE